MPSLDAAADMAVRDAVDAFMDGRVTPDFGGETVFETKNSRYQLLDGVVFVAPDDALIGAELVGWLRDTPRGSAVGAAWQPGSRAVLVDRHRERTIIVTSTIRLLHVDGHTLRDSAPSRAPSGQVAQLAPCRTPVAMGAPRVLASAFSRRGALPAPGSLASASPTVPCGPGAKRTAGLDWPRRSSVPEPAAQPASTRAAISTGHREALLPPPGDRPRYEPPADNPSRGDATRRDAGSGDPPTNARVPAAVPPLGGIGVGPGPWPANLNRQSVRPPRP